MIQLRSSVRTRAAITRNPRPHARGNCGCGWSGVANELRERTRLRFLVVQRLSSLVFPWPGNEAMSRVSQNSSLARRPPAHQQRCSRRFRCQLIIHKDRKKRGGNGLLCLMLVTPLRYVWKFNELPFFCDIVFQAPILYTLLAVCTPTTYIRVIPQQPFTMGMPLTPGTCMYVCKLHSISSTFLHTIVTLCVPT